MNGRSILRVGILLLSAGLVVAPDALTAEQSTDRVGDVALDYAFKFATSIYKDPKDRARAQGSVVSDFVERGQLELATGYANQMNGWRRGVALAEIARAYGLEGESQKAVRLIAQAEGVQGTSEGWHSVRVASRIAMAHAALGDVTKSSAVAEAVAKNDERQYSAQSIATIAASQAGAGDFDQAMLRLQSLGGATDFDPTWWRTQGYVDLAKQESLTRAQRIKALNAAKVSAKGVPGWKQVHAWNLIARAAMDLGLADDAAEALREGDRFVVDIKETMGVRVPLAVMQAKAWADLGNESEARSMLGRGEITAPQVMNIDVPAAWAQVGAGYYRLGDKRGGERAINAALAAAEELVNARPRALAAVNICRMLGQEDVPVTGLLRERLDNLYNGLGDPW